MRTNRTKDMTKGKPARLILSFALPLMLGNIFQQLYTMVDTIIVGRGVGVEALAALGAADWLNWLVLGVIIGFTQGFSILIAQRFGAGDLTGLRKATAMSVILGIGIAILTTAVSQWVLGPLLLILDTPEAILPNATLYLRILFTGIIGITGYNTAAAILRALGDSRTPLYAMMLASGINIALDLLFVLVFGLGVAGAAIATVIAQLCSCLFCIHAIRKIPMLKLERQDFRPEGLTVKRLIFLGAPVAFQNGIIGGGGLAVQYVVNGFGFIFVAGYTATNKLYGLLELAATSFGFAMATYAGQNLGAGNVERIKKGMRSGLVMAVGTAFVLSLLVFAFGRSMVSVFISGSPGEVAQVVDIAFHYLATMGSLLFVLYLLHLYRSALQGMGDTLIPMLSGIIELAMRIGIVMVLPAYIGEYGVYLAEVAAWVGAVILLIGAYYYKMGKLSKKMGKGKP